VSICVKLGWTLKCSPTEFFDLTDSQLRAFAETALEALEDMRR